ncbi:hypothetical protein Cgig2_025395 [Carnegiea gigantea]|uniref:Uncharacterized protein n=1 Tax=Carnegiea gigantea TaxID=171969 RepID=A0A9Q1GZ79_9CARY|nr:hypothetical protein Cgig2_025395 [Carnegiea gigantea]
MEPLSDQPLSRGLELGFRLEMLILDSVNWAKFQKRNNQGDRDSTRKKLPKWIWVPKHKPVVNPTFVSPNDVHLDGANVPQGPLDVMADMCDNFVHKGATNIPIIGHSNQSNDDHGDHHACSDASRTISQPVGTKKSHSTHIGKLHMHKKSYKDCILSKSSTPDVEEPQHSTCHVPAVQRTISTDLSTSPNERDETSAIRRITRSLRKKLESKQQQGDEPIGLLAVTSFDFY